MKKVLIQVVSVITLVFGTCYQSVLALADDRSRTELSGVQLSDSEGNKLHQVKVNETSELEMTVTVNNKDGENAKGGAAMWLPEDQLEVLKDEVKAESAVADTNATLIYERRKKEQPQLKWKNVETTATFKLKLPVQFKETMTKMILPVALGTQRAYLQPLTVVKENTNEEDMAQAGKATELPANLLQSLTSFIASQEAQQAAQAEAPVKDVAKDDAEDQRQADKKAEQDAEDQKKETAKTEDALKKNSKSVTAESKSDGAEREGQSKKATRAGTDLGKLLKENAGEGVKSSLFDSVSIEANGETHKLTPGEPLDVSSLKDFKIYYNWDSESLLKKLGGYQVKNQDFYTFYIKGMAEVKGSKGGSLAHDGEVFATWALEPGDDSESQKVTITFVNEKMNATAVDYELMLEQTYTGTGPIDFEYNGESNWTIDPIETKALLSKEGKFIGNRQIEWTVELAVKGEKVKYSDLVLEDLINPKGDKHSFVKGGWQAFNDDGEDISDKFIEADSNNANKLILKGNDNLEVDTNITFKVLTTYDKIANGTFWNEVGGQISKDIELEKDTASVSTTRLGKTATNYNPDTDTYSWEAKIDFNMDQFGNEEQAIEAIREMVLTDTLSGSHEFAKGSMPVIMIGGNDVTTSFVKDPQSSSTQLILKPAKPAEDSDEDPAKELYELLKDNKTITLAYDTKEVAGKVGDVKNQFTLELFGKTSNVEIPSNDGGLIVKEGELSREVHQDGKAHINWKVTANAGGRAFTTLTVVDLLPEGVDYTDVHNIKVLPSGGSVTMTEGTVKDTSEVGGNNPFNFSSDKNDTDRKAIRFVFDSSFSKKQIEITFDTAHEWGSLSHTNRVGAATDEGHYDYGQKEAFIDGKIRDGSEKSGALNLDKENGIKGNNSVTWNVKFGSHLNHYFGKGAGQVDKVTITDTLNTKSPQYLKFIDSGYKLYALNEKGEDRAQLTEDEDYVLTWTDDNADQRTFTIEFTDKVSDQKYANFRLEFDTPIDIDAWKKGDEKPSSIPKNHEFWNKAQVSYGDVDLKAVEAHESVSSDGIYGQKSSQKGKDTNTIDWEVVLNAFGEDIGYPVITDQLSDDQMHSTKESDLELAFVEPLFTANGDGFNVGVVPNGNEIKLVKDRDYEVAYNSNTKFTIQLKIKVDRPLAVRYKSIMLEQATQYKNHVSIEAGSHSSDYEGDIDGTGNAFMKSWGLRFRKIDGVTGEPLPGATFQLQQRIGNHGEWENAVGMDGKTIDPMTSNPEGYIYYYLLGTLANYRIVEVSPPDNYSGQMAPLDFNEKSAKEDGWDKQAYEFKNYPTLPANLTISKATQNLDEDKEFDFEVRTVDENGNVDTQLQGTYKLFEGGEVTFRNGVSETITVPANDKLTIIGLPLEKFDANGQESPQYYDVRETSDRDDFTTQITVNKGDPIWGKKTEPFKLNPTTASPVTVYFKNTAAKGDLVVNKTVSSETEGELDKTYKFTIVADPTDKVKGNTYRNEGSRPGDLKFNDAGEATFSLRNNEQLRLVGLPEGVKLTVTEEDTGMTTTWSINGEDYTEGNSGSAVINTNNPQTIDVKNSTLKSGQLQITKGIAGNIKADEEFEFEIKTDSKNDGTYPAMKYTVSGGQSGLPEKVRFTNGVATVKLTGDQGIRIRNLPLGEKFTIAENLSDDSDPNIETSWKTATSSSETEKIPTITLTDPDDIESVKYTNALPHGSLELNKRVLNQLPGDQATEFKFTIQAAEDSIDKVKEQTYAVDSNIAGLNKLRFNDKGQATVHMSDKDNVKILGLPVGIKLQVFEEKHPDFNVSHNIDKEDEKEDADTDDIKILDGEETAVNYTNTRSDNGNLVLEKRAQGSYPTDENVNFTIRALELDEDGKNAEELTGKFNATLRDTNGETRDIKVTFTDGKAPVSIKPGEKLEVKNLPTGKYRVIEHEDETVTTTWEVGNDTGTSKTSGKITVDKDATAHVRFTNKLATGKIELNKLVASHDEADKDKEYEFKIQGINASKDTVANKEYDIDISGTTEKKIEFDENGVALVSLKADDKVTISGLPEGVELTISETEKHGLTATWKVNNIGGFQEETDDNLPEVTIVEDKTQVVQYRNVRKVGSLRVDKVVKGAYTDDHHKFKFNVAAQKEDKNPGTDTDGNEGEDTDGNEDGDTEGGDTDGEDDADKWITNTGFNGEYDLKIYDSNGQVTATKVQFTDGVAKLELRAGQYAVIDNLPLNDEERFQVNEVDPEITNMSTTWAINSEKPENGLVADPVVLDEINQQKVVFTNSVETGNVVLGKKLTGAITDADKNQQFEFTLDVQTEDTDNDGEWKTDEAFAGTYTATRTDADGHQITSNVTFVEGQLKVQLKGGERLQISNLPTGTRMMISETVDGDYETSHQIDNDSIVQGTMTEQMTIGNGQMHSVTFINDRPVVPQMAWLSLTKSVLGENGERDREFEFSIRFLDDQMNPLTQTIEYVKTSAIGGIETGQLMLEADGSSTFTLKDGETIRWNVPNGTHYQITESDYTADGYQTGISQGQAPEREGLTATGVAMTNDPVSAKVVYYNRSITPPEEEPHTPEEPDTTDPDFVPPAPESGITTDSSTQTGATPQAHTSNVGTTGSKGFLPQTGEWLAKNWLALLGLVILLSIVGLMAKSQRKND
ncbi:DUF7601 domain-containing protein [Secundilactobacillus mixtipabuli]|uniref:Pilin n=1 Tax=Secundilactobacillus mixtipabuli TaxID=1435342 RepID=A0A1Z5I8V8_9LACO|nr:adhesive domain-containing protein [Secundilactobacillus mixtipabuli]GAW98194.1 pilin precursor [Secundilactobacillus mixtipabuli]